MALMFYFVKTTRPEEAGGGGKEGKIKTRKKTGGERRRCF
jgi:hypothetical protein